MNERFFELPEEKQERILQAGFRVFSRSSYHQAPMNEVAAEAGISKSLLFHYFRNKREFYLYLWEICGRRTISQMEASDCYRQADLFESMRLGMKVKMAITRENPDMALFTLRAFYETDPDIRQDIQESCQSLFSWKAMHMLMNLDPGQFRDGIDIRRMYRDMYLASEGYLWEAMMRNDVDFDLMEQDFEEMIGFWKSIYLRKEKK